jgi:nitroreductase/dihydropteridine reductase
MDTVSLAKRRYTTKAYDASRRIPQATVDALLEQLRHSPSSVNSQPWHFIVADTAEGKARLARAPRTVMPTTRRSSSMPRM